MVDSEKENENSGLGREIVVTDAMIEDGVKRLDGWLARWLTEMSIEGHSGFEKEALITQILNLGK